ncbi:hypothetical protein [Streptomyces fildesensis]|uniref:hypothetical protein n=1 Tax=Streptomyces fildesensis TaxID=375757 RepID=UPI0018E030FB|nr:hypothetical protein [Streptomyces fildesensis]
MTNTDQSSTETRGPFTRTWFIISAGFMACVGGLLAAVLLSSGDDSTDAAPAPSPTTTAGVAPTGAPADGSCPALADTDTRVPTTAPAGVEWTLFQTVALPTSKTAGPAVTEGDVTRCYAHTPTGALLASAQINTRFIFATDWRTVTEKQTIGDGRTKYVTTRTAAEASAGPATNAPSDHGQIAAFKFVTYNANTAVVQQVWRFPTGLMQVSTVPMIWDHGDWKLEIAANGATPTAVTSLADYIVWAGV